MNFKRVIALIIAVVTAFSATACGVDLSNTEEESRTVMTVDTFGVPYEVYRYFVLMHLRDRLASVNTEEGADPLDASSLSDEERQTAAAEIEEYSVESIVNIYSLFTAAKDEGIDPFGEMINSLTDMKMEEIRATYDSDKEYLETIRQFYMNDSVYSVLTRYEIVFEQLYELYVKNGKIDTSDEAVIRYMMSDDAVRVKQILVSFERHSEEEAYTVACDIAKTVETFTAEDGTVDEEQFDALTDKVGEDLFMFKNRDGYYIGRGYSDKAFEDAAFSVEVGHVSEVVRVSAGYSIILRAEKDPDYIRENVSALSETCLGGIYRSALDEYYANAEIVKTAELEKIDIFTME